MIAATALCVIFHSSGLWILIGGGISARLLPGPVDVVQPPLFVVWPGIFIATGVLAIVTVPSSVLVLGVFSPPLHQGLFGFFLGFLPPRVGLTTVLGLLHVLNCLWQVSVMALYQPPVLGFINPSTPLTGLIIAQVGWLLRNHFLLTILTACALLLPLHALHR